MKALQAILLGLPLVLSHACSSEHAELSNPPNIVLFLADDLGWGDVGFHESEIETPVLDRLASEGCELTSFYVQPVCSPTRAALLTGRYPIRYGFQVGVVRPWSESGLPQDEILLPELLRDAGYVTQIVGKWHLGSATREQLPMQRGFDHHYGQYTGLVDYWTRERLGGLDWHRDEAPAREPGYSTHLLRDEAVRIVREHDYKQPLFLYLPFSAPHFPLQAPVEEIERYASRIEDEQRRTYAAMVSCLDQSIGAVLEELETVGQRENTLVLFCSDNGAFLAKGGSNGALRGQKSDLYEGAIRTPALVSWPGHVKASSQITTPLHIVDWFPTLLAVAGLAPPETLVLDGLDLLPLLTQGEATPDRTLLLNTQRKHGAVREGRWKLVVDHHARAAALARRSAPDADSSDPSYGIELFDLEADPGEQNDLARARPELRERLLQQLMSWHESRSEPPDDQGLAPPDYRAPAVFGPR